MGSARCLGMLCLVASLTSNATAQTAAEPKVLRVSMETSETGFDGVQLSDFFSRSIVRYLFDAPLRFAYLAKPGTYELATASEFPTISADYRTFTFHIKPGIWFQDDPAFKGQRRELVANDYLYAIRRFVDPRWKAPGWSSVETMKITGLAAYRADALKSGHLDYDRAVDGLRLIDRYTFQLRLDESSPRLLESFADASMFGAVAREVVEAYGDAITEHPVGTGAFRLAEWRRSSRIVLERSPGYREDVFHVVADADDADAQALAASLDGKRLPLIDRVEVDVITEAQPRWLAFLGGAQDVLERLPLTLAPLALPNNRPSPTLQARQIHVVRKPFIDITMMYFNMDDPVIGGYTPDQVALRRAISLGIDVPAVIRDSYKGQAFVAQSLIPPSTSGYDPTLVTESGRHDVARANALLDTYGYVDRNGDGWRERPDGSPLEVVISTQADQASRIFDENNQRAFNDLRIRVSFRQAAFSEQLRRARAGQYQIWSASLVATAPDGGGTMARAYGPAIGSQNLPRFRSAEFDRLFEQQDHLPDGPERIAVLRDMTRLLVAYVPIKPMTHRYAIDLAYPWVVGYRRWPFVPDWWRYVDIDVDKRKAAQK